MPSQPYQMTFHLGSNDKGKEVFDILASNRAKLSAKNESACIRVALRVLDKLPKNDPLIKEALKAEG